MQVIDVASAKEYVQANYPITYQQFEEKLEEYTGSFGDHFSIRREGKHEGNGHSQND